MYCHLYLRNGTVYVPTMGKMDKGFYRDIEPVAVVSAANIEAVRQALADAIARGILPHLCCGALNGRRPWCSNTLG